MMDYDDDSFRRYFISGSRHKCTLREHSRGVFYLPPNATLWQTIYHHLRSICIPGEGRKSREFFKSKDYLKSEMERCLHYQKWYIIHPLSKLSEVLNWLMFVVWTWFLYVYPLFSISTMHLPRTLRIVSKLLQAIVIFSKFFTGYITPKKDIILEPSKIIKKYLTTYFIFDISGLVTLSVYELFVVFLTKQTYIENFHWYFYLFCYAYFSLIVRIGTIMHILKTLLTEMKVSRSVSFIITNIFKLLYVLHATTCLFYLIPMALYTGRFPMKSWFLVMKIHDPTIPSDYVNMYFRCLTVCVCIFLGGKSSSSEFILPNERLIIAVIGIIGRMYTLFFIASLLQLFGNIGVSESKYDRCILQLHEYMNAKKLPQNLKDKLLEFYDQKLKRRFFNEGEILENLSERLRTEIFLYGARSLIENTPFLKKMSFNVLGTLFAQMKSETYLGGQVIVKAGDEINNIHFIASGTIVILFKDELELGHLKDGNDFGCQRQWVTKKSYYRYTYMAIESTQIYYIPVKVFVDFFRMQVEILQYFEMKTKVRNEYLKKLETISASDQKQENIIATLRAGRLLEPRIVKKFVYE